MNTPVPQAFTVTINHDFLEKAEPQLFEIISRQKAFVIQHRSQKLMGFLRILGILICTWGIFYAQEIVFNTSNACYSQTTLGLAYFLLLFSVVMLIYFFNMQKPSVYDDGGEQLSLIINKQTEEDLEQSLFYAKKLAPYQAKYCVKNAIFQYHRQQEGQASEKAWEQIPSGIAFHNQYVTVIYKHDKALQHSLIIFHQKFSDLKGLLDDFTVKILDHQARKRPEPPNCA